MSSTASFQRSAAIPDSGFSRDKTPDFRARAMAKQAWLVRRSEPRRGLLLGLIAGGAIGCLGAFSVLSVIPSEGPARTTPTAVTIAANQPASAQPASDGSNPDRREVRQVSTDRVAPVATTPATTKAAAPATTAPAATAPVTPASTLAAAPVAPRPDPGVARTEVSSNAKVTAVTPAEPPATQSLTSAAPVLAQGDIPVSKPKVAEKKKKKKVIVRRSRPRTNDFARRDNFFFGWDRMANSF